MVKKLRVQTFGNFEAFVDGKPLAFTRTKTKELFAYLVSRHGALCKNTEVTAIIWENKEASPTIQSMFRTLVADLTQALKAAGLDDVLVKQRGSIGIRKDKISCDLYDFLDGNKSNSYLGEFMSQYRWAEHMNKFLHFHNNLNG